MNYKEAREYLRLSEGKGIVLGLETMRDLLRRMGDPQNSLKFVHIAGTNGKGSVLAYVSTMLKEAGWRVGRYSSPAVFGYEERIQINEEWISKEAVAEGITEIKEVIQNMDRSPTVFEIETALAFWYFEKAGCDLVVLETGMGGDMDATNVITTALCSALTSISFDHKRLLGNSLSEIAGHKAGIIKPGVPVVLLRQCEEVEHVIRKRCEEQKCELILADGRQARVKSFTFYEQIISYKEETELHCPMRGIFQKDNLAIALEVIRQLKRQGYSITEEQIRSGIAHTRWRGRMEVLSERPRLLADGAHNPDAAWKLRKSLEMYFTNQKFIFIIGVLADKEYKKIVEIMMPKAKQVIVITPNHPRALPADKLEKTIDAQAPSLKTTIARNLSEAWKQARKQAKEDDIVVAFGSLSFMGELDYCVKTVAAR